MHVSYFCCEHVATQNQDDFIKVSLMLYVMSFASAIGKGTFINRNFYRQGPYEGLKISSDGPDHKPFCLALASFC